MRKAIYEIDLRETTISQRGPDLIISLPTSEGASALADGMMERPILQLVAPASSAFELAAPEAKETAP